MSAAKRKIRCVVEQWRQSRTVASAARTISPDGPGLKDFVRDQPRQRIPLLGMTKAQIADVLRTIAPGAESMRASQVATAMYRHGARTLDEIASVPADFREALKERAEMGYGDIRTQQVSSDGTKKWLFEFGGPKPVRVETVLIPGVASRKAYARPASGSDDEPGADDFVPGTICVSSQAGCSLACAFCHTGTQPLVRNLLPHEIMGQIMAVLHAEGDFPLRPSAPRRVSNIVWMGQGEPLLNFRSVSSATELLVAERIVSSPARMTVSTSGIPKNIPALADLGVGLALSLHAPTDALRNELVPINKTFPLNLVLDACREYLAKMAARSPRRPRITLEYVMLDGVNDHPTLAKDVVRIVNGLGGRDAAKVNLLPWNPWAGSAFRTSPQESIERFAEAIRRAGVQVNVRTPRGRDIMAACGQLKTSAER
ncbi:radical SAM enzyme, Cfr family [Hyaloraphidium curvatum]|nr:radical SAM enzyme, Cfr family [Hyaloraphidium curvatum]